MNEQLLYRTKSGEALNFGKSMMSRIPNAQNPLFANGAVDDASTLSGTLVANSGDGGMKIDGKSIQRGVVQLVQNGNFADTSGWSSYRGSISVENNICTVTCTEQGNVYLYRSNIQYISGHKYYSLININTDISGRYSVGTNTSTTYREFLINLTEVPANQWVTLEQIAELPLIKQGRQFALYSPAYFQIGQSYRVRDEMCIDLTVMFGAGNEPTTVQEFRSMYSNAYYEYSTTGAPTPSQPVPIWSVDKRDVLHPVQLVQNGNFVDASGWSAYHGNSVQLSTANNRMTVHSLYAGTSGDEIMIKTSVPTTIIGHKYLAILNFGVITGSGITGPIFEGPVGVYNLTNISGTLYGLIVTASRASSTIYIKAGGTKAIDDEWWFEKVQLIDLTAIYGAGNEPTTVAKFRADYPAEYYPYLPSENNDRHVSITDSTVTGGITIPLTELRGINGVCDTLEPRVWHDGQWRSRFTRRIGVVDLGTLDYTMPQSSYFRTRVSDIKGSTLNLLCSKYPISSSSSLTDKTMRASYWSYPDNVQFRDDDFSDISEFIASVTGVTLYYELATPVITYGDPIDIQSYSGETNCFSDSVIQPTICMTAVTHQ